MKPSAMKATALGLLGLRLARCQECGPSSSAAFDYEITPTPGFDIRWSLDTTAETISFEVVYDSAAWVSVGFPSDGLNMIGADAVIGLPTDLSVDEYDMTGKSVDNVTPFPDQEIMDGTITQDGTSGTTTLTFTRPLTPEGSKQVLSSTPGDLTSIIYAYGQANDLAWHGPEPNRGGFEVDLFCGDTVAGGESETPTPSATTVAPSGGVMEEPISESAAPSPTATMTEETVSPSAAPTSLEMETPSPSAAVTDTPAPTAATRGIDLESTAAPTAAGTSAGTTASPSSAEDGADQGDTDAASVVGSGGGWAVAAVTCVLVALSALPLV